MPVVAASARMEASISTFVALPSRLILPSAVAVEPAERINSEIMVSVFVLPVIPVAFACALVKTSAVAEPKTLARAAPVFATDAAVTVIVPKLLMEPSP